MQPEMLPIPRSRLKTSDRACGWSQGPSTLEELSQISFVLYITFLTVSKYELVIHTLLVIFTVSVLLSIVGHFSCFMSFYVKALKGAI